MAGRIIVWLAGIMFLSACSTSYRGGSIEGQVFDAAGSQPLEGVIVVAIWQLEAGFVHPDVRGVLRADETLTDAKGYFRIPAWGPVRASEGWLRTTAPKLLFFKNGYQLLIKSNSIHAPDYDPEVWQSEYDGKQFVLKPFEGDLVKYADHVSHVKYFLKGSYHIGDVCYWEKIPVFTRTILGIRESFKKQDIYNELPSADSWGRMGECRDPQELLGGIK